MRGCWGWKLVGFTGGLNVGCIGWTFIVGSVWKWNYCNTTDEGKNFVIKQIVIMKCWDRMDVPKAISNIVKEIMEDMLGVFGDKTRTKAVTRSG